MGRATSITSAFIPFERIWLMRYLVYGIEWCLFGSNYYVYSINIHTEKAFKSRYGL